MLRKQASVKFINLTRRTEIGANSYYLEVGSHRLVLDCGMHPKNTGAEALPNFKAIGDCEIEVILISHALSNRAHFHDGNDCGNRQHAFA